MKVGDRWFSEGKCLTHSSQCPVGAVCVNKCSDLHNLNLQQQICRIITLQEDSCELCTQTNGCAW